MDALPRREEHVPGVQLADVLSIDALADYRIVGGGAAMDTEVRAVRAVAAPRSMSRFDVGTLLVVRPAAIGVSALDRAIRAAQTSGASGLLLTGWDERVPVPLARLADRLVVPVVRVPMADAALVVDVVRRRLRRQGMPTLWSFLAGQGTDAVRRASDELLAPLVSDASGELCRTLRSYLDHHCSATAAARALNLHRNTVLTRIERARQLLAVDLAAPEDRLALHLATHVVATHESASAASASASA